MRLDTSQHMRLEQQMRLAPRIIQAMEILQLPMMALQERIDAEMISNPVLELFEGGPDSEPTPAAEEDHTRELEQPLVLDRNGDSRDFERAKEYEEVYAEDFARSDFTPRPRVGGSGERDAKMDAMANTAAPEQSLDEYLTGQWAFVEAEEPLKVAGRLILAAIEDDGYLRTPLEDLSKQTDPPIPVETLRSALRLVQTLEPPGVGARDLKECLLLQLAAEAAAGSDVGLETDLVANFLRDIEMNRLPQIVRRTGKSIDEIKSAIENISRLNPRPGSLIGRHSAPVILPDVVVEIADDGSILVSMADSNTPRILISKAYRKLAADRGADRQARQFIRNNIRNAQWLISAIEQRKATVRRVVEEVFKVQRDFLEEGPEALHPLPMADVANQVGVHVATVSRAVAGKYVQTPRGIFPLRMFFSGGTTTAGGEDMAWEAIKVKLRELVDAEDKSKPLNDDELAEALQRQGIDIARRTVAKYRGLLDIPPARKRKQF